MLLATCMAIELLAMVGILFIALKWYASSHVMISTSTQLVVHSVMHCLYMKSLSYRLIPCISQVNYYMCDLQYIASLYPVSYIETQSRAAWRVLI